jgi:hypothetical protein
MILFFNDLFISLCYDLTLYFICFYYYSFFKKYVSKIIIEFRLYKNVTERKRERLKQIIINIIFYYEFNICV